jgi:hypothetical protein
MAQFAENQWSGGVGLMSTPALNMEPNWVVVIIFIILYVNCSTYNHCTAQILEILFFPRVKNKAHHKLLWSCVYSCNW